MRNLARNQRIGNDANRMATCGKHRVGDDPHQPNAAATEDETNAAGDHLAGESFRGLAKLGLVAGA